MSNGNERALGKDEVAPATTPKETPPDLLATALRVVENLWVTPGAKDRFASIILASLAQVQAEERGRCARIAETWGHAPPNPHGRRAALAAAIREGRPATADHPQSTKEVADAGRVAVVDSVPSSVLAAEGGAPSAEAGGSAGQENERVAAAPAEPGASATPLLGTCELSSDPHEEGEHAEAYGDEPGDCEPCRNWQEVEPAPLPPAQPAEPREVLCPSFVALGEYATACGREMPKPPGSKAPVFCCGHSEEAHPVYAQPAEPRRPAIVIRLPQESNSHEDLELELVRDPGDSHRMLRCKACQADGPFAIALSDNGQWNLECVNCCETAAILTEVLAKLR